MSRKSLAFIGLLAAAIVPAVLIASQFLDFPGAHALGLGGWCAKAIAAAAPAVVADAALAGVATPVAVAGALAFMAPGRDETTAFALAIATAIVGWLAYLWLDVVVGQPEVRTALANIVDQDAGPEARIRSLDYITNFATTGRLAFLALGATLAGIKLRPTGASAIVLAASALTLATLTGEARAGTISVVAEAKHFTVTAGVKRSADAPIEALKAVDGSFVYAFDAGIFTSGGYAERIVVLDWTPKQAGTPADGVQPFSVEIPLLLRKWRIDETYRIDAQPFTGTSDATRRSYERMVRAADAWTKFLASLQQATHFAAVVSPEHEATRRSFNTAVDGLSAIAGRGWILPPTDLREQLRQAFESVDARKFRSLSAALDHVESRVWEDLPGIEIQLRGEPCDVAERTFEYLEHRKQRSPRAYDLQVKAGDLLAAKRDLVLKACRATAMADG